MAPDQSRMRRMHFRSLAILSVAAMVAARAATCQYLTARDHPGYVATAMDTARGRVVALGAHGMSEWDGLTWRGRHRPAIEARHGLCQLAYDTRRSRTLLLGGTLGGPFQTLAFDGAEWADVAPTNTPPVRTHFGLAYDLTRDECVLFGGLTLPPNGMRLDDTWVYDGTDWTQRNPPNKPSPRNSFSFSYDHVRGHMVMFGGAGNASWPFSRLLDETWHWYGTTWQRANPATSPPARAGAAMAYDASRSRTVLFGGSNSAWLADTWEYDGSTWQSVPATPRPAARQGAAMVFDPVTSQCLLTGGDDDLERPLRDTWAWDGSRWSLKHDAHQPRAMLAGRPMAWAEPTGNRIVRFQAHNGPPQTWTWDGSWTTHNVVQPPARMSGRTATGPVYCYLYGGQRAAGIALDDLWGWDGSTWQLLAATGPAPGNRALLAYDVGRGELVLYIGLGNPRRSETWIFDGSGWQQRQPLTSPPARSVSTMAHDPLRGITVLHGGWFHSALHDTWIWDGTNWTEVVTPTQPTAVNAVSAFDAQLGQVVMLDQLAPDELWAFDGSDWSLINLAGNPLVTSDRVLVGWPYPDGLILAEEGYIQSLSTVPSRVDRYGSACTPTAPKIAANENPHPGAATFGIDAINAPSNSLVALMASTQSAAIPVLGCTQLVAANPAVAILPTNPAGFATTPLPLPNSPVLAGLTLYFQAAALEPTAPHGFTLSQGLHVMIGH